MIITIDGKTCECEKGEILLQIAKRNDITIPTLCHHEALPGQACCRMCIVEVIENGSSQIVASCMYPVDQECEVLTDSDKIKEERAMTLALMLKHAPNADTIKELAEQYNAPDIASFIEADDPENKCILCGLCVRACKTLGSGAISTIMRGTDKRVTTPYDEPSAECFGCAGCANVCPTGNITMTEIGDKRTIWGRTFDLVLCPECGKPIGTPEQIAYAAKLTDTEPQTLCTECRTKQLAAGINAALKGGGLG